MARGDLTEDEWSLIEPHLPLGERDPIPDLRQQFNAVMWRFRTGSPWRVLPAEHGPWSTVRSWATTGVFEQSMQTVIAEAAARAAYRRLPEVWGGRGETSCVSLV
ncbi:transposase [Nonomuraea muscovyensis]|uniref:Transposase n=1 Tax=Nonomuraea muscovyensis TaxID=1124761 RepID=A0A7X0C369_9ACTN|nr:transposase [Nonomuraea muscovyensis]MBB6347710.1 transposase [Nonomuraea muscovyensis]